MMKRIRRIGLVSLTLVGVLASVALAGPGPGGVTDGDPDHPHFMKPAGYADMASPDDSGSAAPGTSNTVVTEPTLSVWELALRTYLQLHRFFWL